jgi:hypothetical protein
LKVCPARAAPSFLPSRCEGEINLRTLQRAHSTQTTLPGSLRF